MKNSYKKVATLSFILFLILLTWIIVFKFRLDFSSLKKIRSLNLIPFKGNGVLNGMKETSINLFLFIPLGMYLQYFLKDNKVKLMIIPLLSIIYETLQYILQIGVSDITDVIMNTIGGVIGICLMIFIYRFFTKITSNSKADVLLGYISILIPILMLGMLFII